MADQQPIDDALLGKFLAGETDPAESARVREWLAERSTKPSEPSYDDFTKFEQIWKAAGQQGGASTSQSSRSNKPTVDTDAAWRVVQQKMRATNNTPALESEPVIRSLPVQRSERPSGWNQTIFRIAAVLVLVASFGWLVYKLRFMGQDHPEANMMTLITTTNRLSKTLPDGSRILLNRHSTLRYPATFANTRRDVTLTGEAFFDVTPDASRPFRIQARQTLVQVLGTSFTVQAYDANVSIAVRTGKVRFSGGKKAVLLTRNQQATFEAGADTIRRSLQVSANVFAYKTGQLVFDKEPLRDVVKAINELYGADVQLANARIGNCRLTTRFDKSSLESVLAITAETLGLRIRHDGPRVILDGAGCP